jgi:formylglycine-generating enzyme required for sulfatase activity
MWGSISARPAYVLLGFNTMHLRKVAVTVATVAVLAAATQTLVPVAHADLALAASTCPAGFVRIPSGTFMMGSLDTEGKADEHPRHSMTVTGFCMQKLEVTVTEYEACVTSGTCTQADTANSQCNANHITDRPHHPINCINWLQAITYCQSLGARLPTEVEWEYAARGSDGRKYPWGNTPPNGRLTNACDDMCVAYAKTMATPEYKTGLFTGSDGFAETAVVGSYPRGVSPFGVLDMAGNVFEWTSSPYCTYPTHSCTSNYRMYRGGGWYNAAGEDVYAAVRNGNLPTDQSVVVGIRCVK